MWALLYEYPFTAREESSYALYFRLLRNYVCLFTIRATRFYSFAYIRELADLFRYYRCFFFYIRYFSSLVFYLWSYCWLLCFIFPCGLQLYLAYRGRGFLPISMSIRLSTSCRYYRNLVVLRNLPCEVVRAF